MEVFMTDKREIWAYLGLLGLIILVALLIAAWAWLPIVAVVLGVPGGLYLLYWTFGHFHRTHHTIKGRRHEAISRSQQLRIEQERHEQEMAERRLAMHLQA